MNLIYTFILTSLSLIYKVDIITVLGCSPGGSEDKDSAFNEGDQDLIPESGRCPGVGNDNPPWYSCLRNPFHGQKTLMGSSPWSQRVRHK